MLRHDLWNPELARVEYFQTGMLAARTLAPVLEWPKGSGTPLRVLDFAAGYGRVTRFLASQYPEVDLWVAELAPAAVEFHREVLGLQGFQSAVRPEQLAAARGNTVPDLHFDVVLVTSLFSHLPATTFAAWLESLAELLTPEGVLAFSVLDEEVLPDAFSMPESGLFFEPASELEHRLAVQDYGRSWVTEAFVRQRLNAALPSTHPPRRIRRALWHYQDLWLASAESDLRSLATEIDGGPDGRISAVSAGSDGEILIEGWAVHPMKPDREVQVEVHLKGRCVATVRPETPRSDVARHFGSADEWDCGWRVELEVPEVASGYGATARVKVVDAQGLEQILHLGSLESLLADQRVRELGASLSSCQKQLEEADGELQTLRQRLQQAEYRAEVIERSGFGRLRRRWMHLKQRIPGGRKGASKS